MVFPIEEIPGDIIFTLFGLHGRLSNVLKIFPVLRNPYTMDINQVTFSNSLIMGWNHYEILHCDCRTMYNQKKTFLYERVTHGTEQCRFERPQIKKLFKNRTRCEIPLGNEMDLDHFLGTFFDKIINFFDVVVTWYF